MIDRFWPKVQKTDGCWLWLGAKDLDGYGFIKRKDGAQIRAHRFIYEHTNASQIPVGKQVLHSCDNPSCVNPGHLSIGSPLDNTSDMMNKGRQKVMRGENNGAAKLTEEQVLEILKEYGTQQAIADRHGISQTLVGFIKRRVIWRHL